MTSKIDENEKNVENQEDNKKSRWQKLKEASQRADATTHTTPEPEASRGADTIPEEGLADTEEASVLGLEAPELSGLEQKLTESEQKANEYWNDKMRLAAEMQNLTKRHQRDLENRSKYANKAFAEALLAVMDSCHQGLNIQTEHAKAVHEGLELIYQQLLSVFQKFHIQEIDPTGQTFDPSLHEAMLAQPSDQPADTILEVIQRGYQLHGQLLRPARVIVSKGPAK